MPGAKNTWGQIRWLIEVIKRHGPRALGPIAVLALFLHLTHYTWIDLSYLPNGFRWNATATISRQELETLDARIETVMSRYLTTRRLEERLAKLEARSVSLGNEIRSLQAHLERQKDLDCLPRNVGMESQRGLDVVVPKDPFIMVHLSLKDPLTPIAQLLNKSFGFEVPVLKVLQCDVEISEKSEKDSAEPQGHEVGDKERPLNYEFKKGHHFPFEQRIIAVGVEVPRKVVCRFFQILVDHSEKFNFSIQQMPNDRSRNSLLITSSPTSSDGDKVGEENRSISLGLGVPKDSELLMRNARDGSKKQPSYFVQLSKCKDKSGDPMVIIE